MNQAGGKWMVYACVELFVAAGIHAPAHAEEIYSLVKQPVAQWKVRTSFEVIDGRVYVQARINGEEPFRFAVDTGARGMGRSDTSLVALQHRPCPCARGDWPDRAVVADFAWLSDEWKEETFAPPEGERLTFPV